jgi:hypothetical protein
MEEAGPLPPLFLRTNFVIVSKLTEEKLWGRGGGVWPFHLWHKIYQICDFQIVIKCVENAWHSISHTPKIETISRPRTIKPPPPPPIRLGLATPLKKTTRMLPMILNMWCAETEHYHCDGLRRTAIT